VILAALACSMLADATEGGIVRDEPLRLQVMRALFPGDELTRLPSRSGQIQSSYRQAPVRRAWLHA